MREQRQNIFKTPYLTAGETHQGKITDEIYDIIERVGCCTLAQLVDYINTYHAMTPHMHNSHIYGPQEIYNILIKMRGTIHIVEPSDVTIPKANRLVYSVRYENRSQIRKNAERYGIAKMATIIPFLPHSRALYDVTQPGISFIFLKNDMQVEVSVIGHGQEITTCSILDRMPIPKSVDTNKLFRIAIVEDESAAWNITGGGFESVCIVNKERKLQQIRTIEKKEAWGSVIALV